MYTVCSSRYLIFGRIDLLNLIPILILLLYLLVPIDLVYTGIYELVLCVYPEEEQL